jgi:hypothetical protein
LKDFDYKLLPPKGHMERAPAGITVRNGGETMRPELTLDQTVTHAAGDKSGRRTWSKSFGKRGRAMESTSAYDAVDGSSTGRECYESDR